MKRSDVMLIERKGGLTCGLVYKSTIVPSVSIKLWDDGTGMYYSGQPIIADNLLKLYLYRRRSNRLDD